MEWLQPHVGQRVYTPAQFGPARDFVFEQWCDWARQRAAPRPQDLSGACRYGSLFMCRVFGGTLRGHYQHQFNDIDGLLVDLSRDAADVAAMRDPWRHEPSYFDLPELQAELRSCQPRVEGWVERYLRTAD
jgi:hypothetical protein